MTDAATKVYGGPISNRGWNLFLARDQKVETAFKTPEAVFHSGAGSSGERRSHFAVNPTTWTLKASAVLRLEAREAITKSADTATFQRAPHAASCSACISRLLTSCGIAVAKLLRIGERGQR